MALIDANGINNIVDNYVGRQTWLNDVSFEIEGGENELDPIVLLRAYEEKATVDSNVNLAAQFILNKHVTFSRNGRQLLAFTYTGGDLGAKFKSAPYLLDVLLKGAYGLMIKKLTPPSDDSESEERQ